VEQAQRVFGDICTFIHGRDLAESKLAPATQRALKIMLTPGSDSYKQLLVEMAVYCDAGKTLCELTYTLEGDGLLLHLAYDALIRVQEHLHEIVAGRAGLQNTAAVATRLAAPGDRQEQGRLFQHALKCIQPAGAYLDKLLSTHLLQTMQVLKAARLVSPAFVWRTRPTAADVDALRAFACVDQGDICQMQEELAQYTRLVLETNEEVRQDIQQWFQAHQVALPGWARMAKRVFTMQPSSAAAERVFSRFNNTFGDQQTAALEDYIESCMMCQCNPQP